MRLAIIHSKIHKVALLLLFPLLITGCTLLQPSPFPYYLRTNDHHQNEYVEINLDGIEEQKKHQKLINSSSLFKIINDKWEFSANNSKSTSEYFFGFVEFDGNGQFHDRTQIEKICQLIKKERINRDVKVLVFCHGWHNGSQSSDVEHFRNFVATSAKVFDRWNLNNANIKNKYKAEKLNDPLVIGVYFAWPAQIGTPKLINSNISKESILASNTGSKSNFLWNWYFQPISYWKVKNNAFRMATGSMPSAISKLSEALGGTNESKENLALMGHSFGSLVLEECLAHHAVSKKAMPVGGIILVNSAALATTARQLIPEMTNSIHQRGDYGRLPNAPKIVAITSQNDRATSFIQTIGNFFSPLLRHNKREYNERHYDSSFWTSNNGEQLRIIRNRQLNSKRNIDYATNHRSTSLRYIKMSDMPKDSKMWKDDVGNQGEAFRQTPAGHNQYLISHYAMKSWPESDEENWLGSSLSGLTEEEQEQEAKYRAFLWNLTEMAGDESKIYLTPVKKNGEIVLNQFDLWDLTPNDYGGRDFINNSSYWVIHAGEIFDAKGLLSFGGGGFFEGSHNNNWNSSIVQLYALALQQAGWFPQISLNNSNEVAGIEEKK